MVIAASLRFNFASLSSSTHMHSKFQFLRHYRSESIIRRRKFSTTTTQTTATNATNLNLNNFNLQLLLTFPKRNPYATNVGVATVKTVFADYLVQMYLENKDNYDIKRGMVFGAFGCIYLGMVQWWIYVTIFSRVCPNAISFANKSWREKLPITKLNREGWIDVTKQALLDNFVHYTFLYFPVFYVFKNCFQIGKEGPKESESDSEKNLSEPAPSLLADDISDVVGGAMKQYRSNFWTDNMAMWALWLPADFLVYTVPLWLRLPLNHGVSLGWTMILSWMRGGEEGGGAGESGKKLINEEEEIQF